MFGITHFISNILHDVGAIIAVTFVYLKFWSRSAWKSPGGLKARAWIEANPAKAAWTAFAAVWALLLFQFLEAVPIITSHHHSLSLAFVLVGVFLGASVWLSHVGSRRGVSVAGTPPAINGTAHVVSRVRELGGSR